MTEKIAAGLTLVMAAWAAYTLFRPKNVQRDSIPWFALMILLFVVL